MIGRQIYYKDYFTYSTLVSISNGYLRQPYEMTFNGQEELNWHNQQEYKQ